MMRFDIKRFLLFVISVFVVLFYTYFFKNLFTDEIWCYGFGYNIATGLVPYRDFNMIITPLYAVITSLFIIILGHHLWTMHIMNAIMVTIMFFIMYKKLNTKIFILIPIIFLNNFIGYNFLCLFLMIILFDILDRNFKYKDVIIALIVSFIFLTKQTVGMFLFLPMIYYSKSKLKSFISFCIPILILFIYLVGTNSFFNFIDYCFLGMFDFTNSNKLDVLLPLEMFVLICLVIFNIKNKFKCEKLFYILMFQIIVFPIVDFQHFGISMILWLYYILDNIEIRKMYIKYISIVLFFLVFIWGYYENKIYFDNHFYSDKNSYLYGRHIDKGIENSISNISDYMESIKNDYQNIYLITTNSYEIKLNTSYKINKFDLINNGNMGYNGANRFIKEIDESCHKDSCLFIIFKQEIPKDKDKYIQINTDIIYYIYDNYDRKEDVDEFYIYSNVY